MDLGSRIRVVLEEEEDEEEDGRLRGDYSHDAERKGRRRQDLICVDQVDESASKCFGGARFEDVAAPTPRSFEIVRQGPAGCPGLGPS